MSKCAKQRRQAYLRNLAIKMGILIPPQSVNPGLTNQLGVKHDIDLLAVIPGLRVLISISLNTDVLVYNHDLDVAGPLLLLGDNRSGLVLPDIPEPMEMFLSSIRKSGV